MTTPPIRKQGSDMGFTHVTATVKSFNPTGSPIEVRFLVDTGVIDCLLPASMLKRAGIEPESTRVYELADGQVMEFPVGLAHIEVMGRSAVSKVVFGPEGAEPLLGVVALETAGLTVNPSDQSLRYVHIRSLKKVA